MMAKLTKNLEVLLVEDNEGDVRLTRHALEESVPKCSLSVVNDGVDALAFLKKSGDFAEAPTPQLILLDLNMPRMDGKEFLQQTKAHSNLRGIPVVMFTSSESMMDIRTCYDLQASCYVVKPFDGKQFADSLRQIVGFWGRLGQLPEPENRLRPLMNLAYGR